MAINILFNYVVFGAFKMVIYFMIMPIETLMHDQYKEVRVSYVAQNIHGVILWQAQKSG